MLSDMNNDTLFWERVKARIKESKSTQEKLAAGIGIALNTLRGWIHYNRIPDAITACDIAAALGVTAEYLVRGKDNQVNKTLLRRVSDGERAAAKIKKLAKAIEAETEAWQ
jgi:transcriptional regulator with XRE-family HTH domain